jgi:hypothetical protein
MNGVKMDGRAPMCRQRELKKKFKSISICICLLPVIPLDTLISTTLRLPTRHREALRERTCDAHLIGQNAYHVEASLGIGLCVFSAVAVHGYLFPLGVCCFFDGFDGVFEVLVHFVGEDGSGEEVSLQCREEDMNEKR